MLGATEVGAGRRRKEGLGYLIWPDGETCSVILTWEWRVGWPLNQEPGEAVAEAREGSTMGSLQTAAAWHAAWVAPTQLLGEAG